uniref:Putative K+ channel toxin n=1 Tax=Superstitionia donensis TaxID=311983 RepID=A0A1V1WC28_9SCOR
MTKLFIVLLVSTVIAMTIVPKVDASGEKCRNSAQCKDICRAETGGQGRCMNSKCKCFVG